MATRPPRNPLIAVDTNVPLDLADRKEHALDALDVIRRRLKPGRVLVPPTVFQELVFLADSSEAGLDREQARRALRGLTGWQFNVVNLVPVGHGTVERIAILLTGDAHLRGLDFQRASIELKAFDVEIPVIATPREIVAKFF